MVKPNSFANACLWHILIRKIRKCACSLPKTLYSSIRLNALRLCVSILGLLAGSPEKLGPISEEALVEGPLIMSGCIGDSRVHVPHMHTFEGFRTSGVSDSYWLVG